MFSIETFNKYPVVAIIRGIQQVHIPFLANVIKQSHIPAVEITMNTEGASSLISGLRQQLPDHISVGAGTVLSLTSMEDALKAGAEFIVMPTVETEICEYCAANDIPFFPGAFTPNEVLRAWRTGATMVKVFPAKYFGPGYIKELKGPLDQFKLLACGGVNKKNVTEYKNNGADAFAIGGSLIPLSKLNENDYTDVVAELLELKELWDEG